MTATSSNPARECQPVTCAVCGKPCKWVSADPEYNEAPEKFGGWYCKPCDAFSETDIDIED